MFRLSGLTCDFSYLFDRCVPPLFRGPRLSRWEWTASCAPRRPIAHPENRITPTDVTNILITCRGVVSERRNCGFCRRRSFRRSVRFFRIFPEFCPRRRKKIDFASLSDFEFLRICGIFAKHRGRFCAFFGDLTKNEDRSGANALDFQRILRNCAKSRKVKGSICWFVRFLRILRIIEARGIL